MIINPTESFKFILKQYQNGGNNFRTQDDSLAYHKYQVIKESMFCTWGNMVEISLPRIDTELSKALKADVFVVEMNLTNVGEGCLLTLERGCCWNVESSSFDPFATEDWYREFLVKNHVPEAVMALMEKVDDLFLKPIKHEYIAFKLQASRVKVNDECFYTVTEKEGE